MGGSLVGGGLVGGRSGGKEIWQKGDLVQIRMDSNGVRSAGGRSGGMGVWKEIGGSGERKGCFV